MPRRWLTIEEAELLPGVDPSRQTREQDELDIEMEAEALRREQMQRPYSPVCMCPDCHAPIRFGECRCD